MGENDHNLDFILSQLQIILETFSNNTVIVLNVLNNVYLDVNKLNYSIKNVCRKFKKCQFIQQTSTKLSDICKSVNYHIDCNDYRDKYVNPSEIRKRIASCKSKISLQEPKKGTIPYYFKVKSLLESTKLTDYETRMSSNAGAQKGTIPYYFSVQADQTKVNDIFFRA